MLAAYDHMPKIITENSAKGRQLSQVRPIVACMNPPHACRVQSPPYVNVYIATDMSQIISISFTQNI